VSTVFLEGFSAASSYDLRRGEVRVWLLGVAARCLADQRRSDYRRLQLVSRLGAAPELRGDEHERVEAMLDAARLLRHARPFIISTLPSPGILVSYAQLRRLPTSPTRLGDALNRLAAS
jgi:hypothetical protein